MESTPKTVKELGLVGKMCSFCLREDDNELKYGKFYFHANIAAHYYCLLFSSSLMQKGKDNEGILGFLVPDLKNELARGQKLVCYYCKQNGATIGCCEKKCRKTFHLLCGIDNGSLHQFFATFKSYCEKHRPMQKVYVSEDGTIMRKTGKTKLLSKIEVSSTRCPICLEDIEAKASREVLWAPCCKRSAFFHRDCLQRLALNAGYFFKCPLCNNQNTFRRAMLQYGIHIPRQDASWELEPNAFQDLLERHSTCDAKPCYCPKGRKFDGEGSRWELLFCESCGSHGVHIACGGLSWNTTEWICHVCHIGGDSSDSMRQTVASRVRRASSMSPVSQDVDIISLSSDVPEQESDSEIVVDDDNEAENHVPFVSSSESLRQERSPTRTCARTGAVRRSRGEGVSRRARRSPYQQPTSEEELGSHVTERYSVDIRGCGSQVSVENGASILRSSANNLRYFVTPGNEEVRVYVKVARDMVFLASWKL